MQFPPGKKAALAISIDCDGCTVERCREVLGFWNGELGLPVATSMFLFARNPSTPPQASYLDGDRDALRELYDRGWIDTLHSLGDLVAPVPRDEVARAFETLRADGVRLEVWTNHGGPVNAQKLGVSTGRGDLPGDPAYVADLVRDYGIRYVWPSELTHLVGQGRPATAGEWYRTYPGASGMARLLARILPPRPFGIEPYPGNAQVEPRTLRDGWLVLAFRRYGLWRFDTIPVLPRLLAPAVLDRLVESGGSMILYLHIGPAAGETPELTRAGLDALREVARRPEIWVARTVDLLRNAVKQPG